MHLAFLICSQRFVIYRSLTSQSSLAFSSILAAALGQSQLGIHPCDLPKGDRGQGVKANARSSRNPLYSFSMSSKPFYKFSCALLMV